jgi:hypothetical protein
VPETTGHDDPIVRQSLSGPLLVASLLLMLSLAWALYAEFIGLRPWKSYQSDFVDLYGTYLATATTEQAEKERAIRESSTFQRLEQQLKEAEEVVSPQVAEIDDEVRILDRRIAVLTDVFAAARGEVTAVIYQAETRHLPGGNRLRRRGAGPLVGESR